MWAYPRITILAARRHPGESWGRRGLGENGAANLQQMQLALT